MAKPITLITGEPFLITKDIQKRTGVFTQKYGAESIFVFANHPLPTQDIINTITGGGLFASKSLIIIHGLPLASDDRKSEKEKSELDHFINWFIDNYGSISPDNIIMFISPNPDKRGKLYKLFDTASSDSNLDIISHVTNDQTGYQIIHDHIGEWFTSAQIQSIVNIIGTKDLYRIWYEAQKLQDYATYNNGVTLANVHEILTPHIEQDSFAVIDAILYKTYEDALSAIDRLQQLDDTPYAFLGGLYRSLRGVIMIVDAMNHGITSNSQLMSLSKLPPFAVGRIMKNIHTLQHKSIQLTKLFHTLIDLEYSIKSGQIPVQLFWPLLKTALMTKEVTA